jgi:hypothetical protein
VECKITILSFFIEINSCNVKQIYPWFDKLP